jgi:uncharacterized protein YceH (UPF0502 family)
MEPKLPLLSAEEQRVLGSLIEKSRATPEYYPMTLNSLQAACNQKSSRKPVVQYEEDTVINALNDLKKKGLISTVTGGTSRSVKYRHSLAIQFPLIPAELAVLCLLLLRGPLTAGEINSNSARLFEFETLEEVQEVLEKLAGGGSPFVIQLPKRSGQKETRYMHLMGGMPDLEHYASAEESQASFPHGLESRIAALETEVAVLKELVEELKKQWES